MKLPGPSDTITGRAFSLIELIGVLGVLTILALALMPAVIKEYDRAARNQETRALEAIAEGYRQHILRAHAIPSHTNWAQAIAIELGWQIADVATNARGQPRIHLIDPAVTATFPIPYSQGPFGVTNTIGPGLGVIFLSSVGTPLPAGITSGFAATSAAFSNIWNVAEGQIPVGWNWDGQAADLVVQRVTLDGLFVPLILNYATQGVTNKGRFRIGNLATNILPTSPSFVTHYLKGTPLELHHHAGSANTLQVREILQHPLSFIYEGDVWRGHLFLGRGLRLTSGLDLQAAHDLFVAAPQNVNAKGNPQATPVRVVTAVSNYLRAYINWSAAGFPGGNHATRNAVENAQDEMEDITVDLLHKPSGG